jgi:hypothetical protein
MPATGRGLAEHLVVVHRVVGTVDDQHFAVDVETSRLRDVRREDFYLIAGVDGKGNIELTANQDGLALPGPQISIPLDEVVQPGRARLLVVDLDLAWTRHGGESLLGRNQRRADMADVTVADTDEQHRRVAVRCAVRRLRVERRVTRDAHRRPLYGVNHQTVRGERVDDECTTVQRLLQLRGCIVEERAACERNHADDGDETQPELAT